MRSIPWVFVGVWMWLVQPLYLVLELAAVADFRAPYSLLANTISDLGSTTCTTIAYPLGPVPVCSPAHGLVNAAFVVFGLLTGVGSVLLRPRLPPGRLVAAATVLWVVAGVSSVATGLVPLDQDLGLHYVVSIPAFLAQPAALVLTALAVRRRWPRVGWSGAGLGMLTVVAGVVLTVWVDNAQPGLWERLALWPAYLWMPVLATRLRPMAQRSR